MARSLIIPFNRSKIRICIYLVFTCPLENGAPKTATLCLLFGCKVFPSLVLRRRNSGPLKAIFQKKETKPIWGLFYQRNWWKVPCVLRCMMSHLVALTQQAGLMERPRLLYIHEPGHQWRKRPPPNLFSQHNVRATERGCFFVFFSKNSSSVAGDVLRASNVNLVGTPPDYPMRKWEKGGFDCGRCR